ncbi:MAG: 2-amino-4-hydroxy-6-hydroxymethyldihydropteridine diphosphokinase, partial [Pseudomonadota bacterium]|nr:2-amino-4-hydroxy-6-hydroxymethyldihydropteridine diphosphokinase [Pseudomonadota bacterium]
MTVLLGLGSNLGDRCANLEKAMGALAALSGTSLLRWSTVYESEALLAPESPPTWDKPFLNVAVELSTPLKPHELLAATQEIERRLGRVDAERWAPRIIDVDMLAYDDESIVTPDLVIPHVGVSERAFVLAPLAEIVPSRRLPGTKE